MRNGCAVVTLLYVFRRMMGHVALEAAYAGPEARYSCREYAGLLIQYPDILLHDIH